jgi:hypothetical protein
MASAVFFLDLKGKVGDLGGDKYIVATIADDVYRPF